MMGLLALSGVVVNDSLVLIHTANRMRDEGKPVKDAVSDAGIRRFPSHCPDLPDHLSGADAHDI